MTIQTVHWSKGESNQVEFLLSEVSSRGKPVGAVLSTRFWGATAAVKRGTEEKGGGCRGVYCHEDTFQACEQMNRATLVTLHCILYSQWKKEAHRVRCSAGISAYFPRETLKTSTNITKDQPVVILILLVKSLIPLQDEKDYHISSCSRRYKKNSITADRKERGLYKYENKN